MNVTSKDRFATGSVKARAGQSGFFTAGLGLALAAFLGAAAAGVVTSGEQAHEAMTQQQSAVSDTEIHVDP